MNGYTSHTYIWGNTRAECFWVKYHFKINEGVDFLTLEETNRIGGKYDPDMPLSEVPK